MSNTPSTQIKPEDRMTGKPGQSQTVINLLGYAGLAPFVAAALLAVTDNAWSTLSLQIANAYAFGIVSFLTGTWWGLALRDQNTAALWLSNVFFLLSLSGYVLLVEWWPLMAALTLLAVFLLEQKASLFPPFPAHYRTIRTVLTAVAGLCMLVIQFSG